MNKIVERTKDLLIGKQAPVTKDSANMLALTGKVCTLEERTKEFLKGIDETIITKSRSSIFMYLVEVPEELKSQINSIKKDISDRGFTIHELEPTIENVFVINWK